MRGRGEGQTQANKNKFYFGFPIEHINYDAKNLKMKSVVQLVKLFMLQFSASSYEPNTVNNHRVSIASLRNFYLDRV